MAKISGFFFLFLTIICLQIYPQIVFRENPSYLRNISIEKNLLISSNSEIFSLSGEWTVAKTNEPEKKFQINIPSIFEGEADFTYSKKFCLNENQVKNNKIEIIFLGLSYSADISVNKALIHRHPGGEIPFSISLPRDILYYDKENLVEVKLSYHLTSETTIPLKKRFFYPKSYGGIFRDVLLKVSPPVNIQNVIVNKFIDFKFNRVRIDLTTLVENKEPNVDFDTGNPEKENFILFVQLFSPDGKNLITSEKKEFQLKRNKEININSTITFNSPILWAPDSPTNYKLKVEVIQNNNVIDFWSNLISFFDLQAAEKTFRLNNTPFQLKGVTYAPAFLNLGQLISLEQLDFDIKKIKQSGFNSVRFLKTIPHPYALRICEIYGLIPIIDIPLSDLTENLVVSTTFKDRVKSYLDLLLKSSIYYSNLIILNLGTGYLSNSTNHKIFLKEISSYIKSKKNILVSASFWGEEINPIEGIDFYGIEILNQPVTKYSAIVEQNQNRLGKGKVFISEATYTVNIGQSDGYSNLYSYEAQAKFVEDLIKFSESNQTSGFFINSMFDFRGDFGSLFFSYDSENLYKVGLISEDRVDERIAYKVVTSYLQNTERVTIPIGTNKDDSPMIFIITGLFVALFMGVLVNSGKKFREDAKRALLRPYNFYADIRDQRIISGYQSIFLMMIICLTTGLVISNFNFYFKNNLFLEKLLLSFGSKYIMMVASYLAWNPLDSTLILFAFSTLFLFALMIIIKLFSFFLRSKVPISNIFFVVVWALLPVVLFIPIGIILYRILNIEVLNNYIYISLILIKIWLIFRIMRGVYVIFDVRPSQVYFYGILFFITIFSMFILYFEINNSLIDNLLYTLKQFRVI